MIEPHIEQGGASSWFWIAAKLAVGGRGDAMAGFASVWPFVP